VIFLQCRRKENCTRHLPKGPELHLTHREFERLVLPELDSVNIERLMKDNAGREQKSDSPHNGATRICFGERYERPAGFQDGQINQFGRSFF
jgi:hypothetical protein